MITLSVNETKWSSFLARSSGLILYISIWIFDFGPEKLPGLSSNGPHRVVLYKKISLNENEVWRNLFQTQLLSRLSKKVCHFLSSPVLLRNRLALTGLAISIWIFYFGPEKLPGLSSNGPHRVVLYKKISLNENEVWRNLFQTQLLSRLSKKVCHFLSSPVLLRNRLALTGLAIRKPEVQVPLWPLNKFLHGSRE